MMFVPARSTGQWWVRVDGAVLPILFPKKFRLHRAEETPSSVMVVPRSRLWVAVAVRVDTGTKSAARWSMPQSAVLVEELPETQLVVRKRLQARRDRASPVRVVQGIGIRAAAVVRVGWGRVIRQTADLACWFRFWVVTCTGVVVEEDQATPVLAEMVGSEVEVVERSIPPPAERV
jgi:hypothetical protein